MNPSPNSACEDCQDRHALWMNTLEMRKTDRYIDASISKYGCTTVQQPALT